jgi:hypothetical protein
VTSSPRHAQLVCTSQGDLRMALRLRMSPCPRPPPHSAGVTARRRRCVADLRPEDSGSRRCSRAQTAGCSRGFVRDLEAGGVSGQVGSPGCPGGSCGPASSLAQGESLRSAWGLRRECLAARGTWTAQSRDGGVAGTGHGSGPRLGAAIIPLAATGERTLEGGVGPAPLPVPSMRRMDPLRRQSP